MLFDESIHVFYLDDIELVFLRNQYCCTSGRQ